MKKVILIIFELLKKMIRKYNLWLLTAISGYLWPQRLFDCGCVYFYASGGLYVYVFMCLYVPYPFLSSVRNGYLGCTRTPPPLKPYEMSSQILKSLTLYHQQLRLFLILCKILFCLKSWMPSKSMPKRKIMILRKNILIFGWVH